MTTARRIIFEAVMHRRDHFRAEALARELAHGPNRVSRGTVYRTLSLMTEAGFVRIVRDGDSHFHYEHIFGRSHHEHMVCERCGTFIEFQAPEIMAALKDCCQKMGFQESHHRLTVFGLCANCRKKA